MPTYPVLEPLKHDGQAYAPGDSVEMDAKAARELLLLGVLGPAAKAAAKTAAKAETKAEAKPEDQAPAKDDEGAGQGEGEEK